jgi:hypothetical protein
MNLANAPVEVSLNRGLNEYVKDALLEACKNAARPLVRLCLKHGISFQDLAGALKYVFVESAKEDHLREVGSTPARIAVLTGMPRREVEAIENTEPASKIIAARMTAATQVLSAWHSDPDFTGPYGIPLELPYDTPFGFVGLAERYGNDLSPEEILDDLVQVGCVARGKGGMVNVIRRSYISEHLDPVSLGYVGKCLRSLAETLEFNLEKTESRDKRFERRFFSTSGIRTSDLEAFDELVRESGQKFLEDLDSWTSEREKALKNLERIPNEIPRVYPGVGIYLYFNQGRKGSSDK